MHYISRWMEYQDSMGNLGNHEIIFIEQTCVHMDLARLGHMHGLAVITGRPWQEGQSDGSFIQETMQGSWDFIVRDHAGHIGSIPARCAHCWSCSVCSGIAGSYRPRYFACASGGGLESSSASSPNVLHGSRDLRYATKGHPCVVERPFCLQ